MKRLPISVLGMPLLASMLLASACDFASRRIDEKPTDPKRSALASERLRRGPEPPASPEALLGERASIDSPKGVEGLRRKALREAAHAHGSQHGYARRAWEILGILEDKGRELSREYDFRLVARPAPSGTGYVVPPSVSLSVNLMRIRPNGVARAADEQYEIVEQGRLAPRVPTWRDYLLFYPQSPAALPASLEPMGDEEEVEFRKWIEQGWNAGTEQANSELEIRLSKLRRTYEGMLRFRKLADRGIVERLLLESTDPADSASPSMLRTGERAARIVAQAGFRADDGEYPSRDRIAATE